MTQNDFRKLSDNIICERVQNCCGRTYRALMNYCENTYRACVGFDANDTDVFLAELVCYGITGAYIHGKEDA